MIEPGLKVFEIDIVAAQPGYRGRFALQAARRSQSGPARATPCKALLCAGPLPMHALELGQVLAGGRPSRGGLGPF
jgi:hypothetical protein